MATINSTQTFVNKTISNGTFIGSTVFEEEINIKESNSYYSGSIIFYHPNNSSLTRLYGSYYNTNNSTGYLVLPQGNGSSQTLYTLATTNSTQTFTNKTIVSGIFTGSTST